MISVLQNKENKMKPKLEGSMEIIAALLVLFSAMWDPRVSVTISIVSLVAFGIYRILHKES
jgi:hypothetical protein